MPLHYGNKKQDDLKVMLYNKKLINKYPYINDTYVFEKNYILESNYYNKKIYFPIWKSFQNNNIKITYNWQNNYLASFNFTDLKKFDNDILYSTNNNNILSNNWYYYNNLNKKKSITINILSYQHIKSKIFWIVSKLKNNVFKIYDLYRYLIMFF